MRANYVCPLLPGGCLRAARRGGRYSGDVRAVDQPGGEDCICCSLAND